MLNLFKKILSAILQEIFSHTLESIFDGILIVAAIIPIQYASNGLFTAAFVRVILQIHIVKQTFTQTIRKIKK